jgi:hypothetical protein
MIKFINTTCDEHKPYTAVESIEMNIADESSLPDILEAFEGFLKASGYHIPEGSYIDVVQDEENVVQYADSKVDDYGLHPMFRIVE